MPNSISKQKCNMCWQQEGRLVEATHKIQDITEPSNKPMEIYLCDKHFNSIFKK